MVKKQSLTLAENKQILHEGKAQKCIGVYTFPISIPDKKNENGKSKNYFTKSIHIKIMLYNARHSPNWQGNDDFVKSIKFSKTLKITKWHHPASLVNGVVRDYTISWFYPIGFEKIP